MCRKNNENPVLDLMKKGKYQMFKGPLNDNEGHEVIPDGKAFDDEDPELWQMNYLVEGVIGSRGR